MVSGCIGKYQVERRLGGGGMAEVFLARVHGAAGFSRRVAIKRVLPGYSDHATFASLFISEAQLSSQLTHSNIVSVLDFEHDAEHGLFLVMELVEGKDLSQLLATGMLPTSLVIYLVTEVLRGLGYAHNLPGAEDGIRGVVHRDVSPHNVLLSWEGAVKVADFGIAKSRAASHASASVMVKGKTAYMSPEQANGEPLDGRSDLFAVGVMLWEMLTGQSLFSRETMQQSLAALFFATIPSPQAVRANVAEDVAFVAMRLLQRNREDRYATAEDTIRDLLACSGAPRDGRAELVGVLEARFAGRAGERARVPTLVPTSWPGGTPAALLPTILPGSAPQMPSASAAPASLPRAPSRAHLGWIFAAVALGAAAATGMATMWATAGASPPRPRELSEGHVERATPLLPALPSPTNVGSPPLEASGGSRPSAPQKESPPTAPSSVSSTSSPKRRKTGASSPSQKRMEPPTSVVEQPPSSGIIEVKLDGSAP